MNNKSFSFFFVKLRFKKEKAGFTLIELMIVIALIGVLAGIAIPTYSIFRTKAKTTEAITNLAAIRTHEEAYRSENETYIEAPANPAAVPAGTTVTWVEGIAAWEDMGFGVSGTLRYQYSVTAGDAGIATSFTANAQGDLDGDGAVST